MRVMLMAGLVAMAMAGAARGQGTPTTPTAARQAYESELRDAQKQHEQLQESARAKYLVNLESLLQQATMAGNLDLAIKIRDEITAVKAAGKSAGDIEPTRTKLAGTAWTFERNGGENAKLTFSPDGSVKFNDGPAGGRRWVVLDSETIVLLLGKDVFRLKFNSTLTQYAVQSGHVEIKTTWTGGKRVTQR